MSRAPAPKLVKSAAPAAVNAADPLKASTYAKDMAARWALATAMLGGSEAMRAAGKTLLPQHVNEEPGDYANRLARSTLLPVFSQTIDALADMVFSEPMTFDGDVSDELWDKWSAIDTDGAPLDAVARQLLMLALAKGEAYLIADEPVLEAPADGKPLTKADRDKAGVRPYFALIEADNMLAYETALSGGKQTTVYARWREIEYRQNDAFEDDKIERVIEWRPGRWIRHERVNGGQFARTEGDLRYKVDGQSALPIRRFRLGKVDGSGKLLGPLHGLAEKNVEHWQSASDQRAILTVSRFPMLAGSGVTRQDLQNGKDGRLIVGPNATLFASSEQSKFYFVETNGAAIAAGEKDLERLERDMAQLAFQPLIRQQAGVTATKDALAESKANCSLSAWANELALFMTGALEMLAHWEGVEPPAVSVVLNDEFGIDRIDQTMIAALQAMRGAGDISRPQYIAEMIRNRVLSEEFDAEANEAELEAEGPAYEPIPDELDDDDDDDDENPDDPDDGREPPA